jgi:hypothetical protein
MKNTGKVRQAKLKAETEFRTELNKKQRIIMKCNAHYLFCLAMHNFTLGLVHSKQLCIPPGEESRYRCRFESFAALSNLNVSYDIYVKNTYCIDFSCIIFLFIFRMTETKTKNEYFTIAVENFENASESLKSLANETSTSGGIQSAQKIFKQNAIVSRLCTSGSLNVGFHKY